MIKVLIADDQKTVQEILRGYIEDEPNLELVACANNGQEALDIVKESRPHIVLMDIEMPVLDGLTATKIITEQFIDTYVLIISVHNEENYLNTALQVGAKGYLLKNTPAKELINSIYSAYKGYFQLGPGLLEKYLYRNRESTVNSQDLEELKIAMMQQFQSLSQKGDSSSKHRSRSRRESNSVNRDYIENQYAGLEKQLYITNSRLDKLSKKIVFLQQSILLVILGCAITGILVILFSL